MHHTLALDTRSQLVKSLVIVVESINQLCLKSFHKKAASAAALSFLLRIDRS